MQVDSKLSTTSQANTQKLDKGTLTSAKLDQENIEKLKNLGGKGITQIYLAAFRQDTLNSSFQNFSAQASSLDLLNFNSSSASIAKAAQAFSNVDFAALGYTGKNPLSMNTDELNALLGENGFFGIENTASRIADFVIQGAGDDLEKLQKGFEGMKEGFKQAEKLWGGDLPKISQDTINKAIEKVSARIQELGGNAIDLNT